MASRHSGRVRGRSPSTPSQTTRAISGHTQRGVCVTIWKMVSKGDGMAFSGDSGVAVTFRAARLADHLPCVERLAFFAI